MIRRYDFKCPNEHVEEQWVDHNVTTSPCPLCSSEATRLISAPIAKLDPLSGDFAGATMKWAKQRAQKIEQERKATS